MAGVKGKSGRKSAYQENKDAKALHALFFAEQDQDKLEKKIGKGKFAVKDRFILTAMEGDSRVLNKLLDKIFPDGIDLTSGGKPLLIADDDE